MKKHNVLYIFSILLSLNLSQDYHTLSGFITDSQTGESIVGANIYLSDTKYGSSTDLDGYFIILDIPRNSYNINVSYLGYEKIERNISINQSYQINFELKPKPLTINEIKVSGEQFEQKNNFQSSRIKLNTLQLRNIPRIADADLFRSLQSLPGILTQNDFSTGLVIRGGNTDQNLILLDGITVYNPSHVGGVFSNFILDAIKEVDLQKGGYNAEYGGRLSAVLKVTSREGNSKKFRASTSISFLSGQILLEGPINDGAWLIAGRRTYFDQIFKGTDFYFPYFFYDLQGHVYHDIDNKQRISLSLYRGEDNLKWDDEFGIEAIWRNNTLSLNYRVLHSQKLLSNWMIAKSKFDIFSGLGRNSSDGIVEKDYIDDLTFKSDWILFLPQERQLNFGLESKDLRFYYNSNNNGEEIFKVNESPIESGVYTKYKFSSNNTIFQPGIRINYYSNLETNWYIDPRLQIKHLIDDGKYFNFSIGQYHQFMSTIQDDFNPTIIDAWFATDESVKPGSSQQIIIGLENYYSNDIHIQAEAYYKKLNNMLTFVDRQSTVNDYEDNFTDYTVIDSLVDLSNGYSYGIEIFAQKKTGKINGWANYTYSVSRKIFNEMEYYTNWDRTHVFNILGNYKISDNWDLNFKWTYQTGQPYTPILGYYIESFPPSENEYEVIPGGRNSARFSNYNRLDFGAVRHYTYKNWKIDIFIQIINLFWDRNVFTHQYIFGNSSNGVDDDGDGNIDNSSEDSPIKKEVYGFPLLPTIGVKIDF